MSPEAQIKCKQFEDELVEKANKNPNTSGYGLIKGEITPYNIHGKVSSLLLEELIAEKIPYIKIDNIIYVNQKDESSVRNLNKEVLKDLANTGLETNKNDLSRMLMSAPEEQARFVSIENLEINDVMDLFKNSKDIPSLIFCTSNTGDKYTVSVQKDMISTRNSKCFGQAYLETVLNNQITDPASRANDHRYEQSVQKYLQENPVSDNEYYITSEIDPSVFMMIGKDGFSINNWKVNGKDLVRTTIQKVQKEDENYLALLYKGVSSLPDVKIINTKGELSDFLIRRGKDMKTKVNLKTLRMKRGVKKLARIVNAMVLLKNPNKNMTFGEYNKEVAKIMSALHQGIVPEGYDSKNIDKLNKIIKSYGIEEINFGRVSNFMDQVPQYADTVITREAGITQESQNMVRG